MSVMIKGMEMPKYKGEHKNFDRYGCFLTVYKNGKVKLHIFENDYVVGEIPTLHGRLIDADELTRWIERAYGDKDIIKLVTNDIKRQPTIIETEVSE